MIMKDILQNFKTCKKSISKKEYGNKSYPYYRSSCYLEALEELVGLENVEITYTPMQFLTIQSGQELFYLSCTVTIRDENGKTLSRTGYGGREVSYNSQQREVNLSNLPESVQKVAFKNACKAFGLLIPSRQDNAASGKPSASSEKQSTDHTKQCLTFITSGSFFICAEQKGRSVYKVQAHLVCGDRMESKISEIVFYPNRTSKCVQDMNRYIAKAKSSPCELQIEATESGIRDDKKQYVFSAFV